MKAAKEKPVPITAQGATLLPAAVTTAPKEEPEPAAAPARAASTRRGLRQGFLSNLSNPKIAVFFTSFLPQFATPAASFIVLLALGLVFCLMTLVWLCAYGVAAARAGDVLRRRRVRQALESRRRGEDLGVRRGYDA